MLKVNPNIPTTKIVIKIVFFFITTSTNTLRVFAGSFAKTGLELPKDLVFKVVF